MSEKNLDWADGYWEKESAMYWECDYCDERSLHNHITEQMLISIANSLKDIADSLKKIEEK